MIGDRDRFSVICSDPPWHEPGGRNRGSDDRFPTLDRAAIAHAMVAAEVWRPADDCLHFMWTTMTSLVDGIWLMDALGFRYVTHGVWVKRKAQPSEPDPNDARADENEFGAYRYDITLGQYFRGAHELYLLGVRGRGFNVRSDARKIPSVIEAPTPRAPGKKNGNGKRVHSRKPEAFYRMVERRTVGARLEMFARDVRPGWTGWGNDYPSPASTTEIGAAS